MHARPRRGGRAGFVLAGGDSTRMGRDKALLPCGAQTMIEFAARQVASAAGSVVIIGHPERYRRFGYPVIADIAAGCGPLGGIETALCMSKAAWNLVVACDMPGITAVFLSTLLDEAERSGGDCLVPVSDRLEPLCAAYHADFLPRIREARKYGVLALRDVVAASPRAVLWPVENGSVFRNVNTPEDFTRHAAPSGGVASHDA